MSQPELLRRVIGALEAAGIEYMVTGSVVSSLQGVPRSTHDIDLLINVKPGAAGKIAQAFPPPDFHVDQVSVAEAISRRGTFNVVDNREGTKVDFWLLTDSAFDRSRFSRRYVEEFMGIRMAVSSPEDTILAKLWWAKRCGGSEKQCTDALRVYELQYTNLNIEYLEGWVKRLDLGPLWQSLKSEAQVEDP